MTRVCLQALIFIWVASTCTQPFQWTDGIDDSVRKCVVPGDDLHLPWAFSLAAGETVTSQRWYFHGHSEELIGMIVNGNFTPLPAFEHRVSFVPGAGIALANTLTGDRGNYTVEVKVQTASSGTITERRTVTVEIIDVPTMFGDHIDIRQDKVAVYDNSTDQWSIQLSCGHFISLGQPPVHVVWHPPTGPARLSSSFSDGYYHLLLPNPVEGGSYRCNLPTHGPATNCLPSNSSLQLSPGVVVDEIGARLTVIEAHEAALQTENRLLEEKESNMTEYIHSLEQKVQNLTQQQQYHSEVLEQVAGPCGKGNYSVIDDERRDVNWGSGVMCDDHLPSGWYRFFLNGANAVIPTTCPPDYHCGALRPIWLDLHHHDLPAAGHQISVAAHGHWNRSCRNTTEPNVTIRNCGTFFVYRLQKTSCPGRYCVTMK